jgi:hypothetical protein
MVDVGDDGDVAKFHGRALLAAEVRRREDAGTILLNSEVTGMRRCA